MKSFIVAVGVTSMIGGTIFLFYPQTTKYVAPEIVKETVEVHPDWAQDEDAVQAAKDVIRKKELEAELSQLQVEKAEENERHRQETDRLDAEIELREKELGTF